MTIGELSKQAVKYLKDHGVENSILDAHLILCDVLQVARVHLIAYGDQEVDKDMGEKIEALLQLRVQGMPLQYILGAQEFMSLPFNVNQHVLIPRADTETLVEFVLAQYGKNGNPTHLKAMDIGTGSGCIAISLCHYIRNLEVWAVDKSEEALKIAAQNAQMNGVGDRIHFIHQDILQGVPRMGESSHLDFIVSNPPYIPTKIIGTLQKEVQRYEPFDALDGGEDGLLFYPIIMNIAAACLKQGGMLILEVGHDQREKVIQMFEAHGGYYRIETALDLAGITRMVAARRGL